MPLDPAAALAYTLVAAELAALGWLSGLAWPGSGAFARLASWCVRFLVGALLVGVALLLQALAGVSLGLPIVTLLVAGLAALLVRLAVGRLPPMDASGSSVGRRDRAVWALLAALLVGSVVRAALVPEAGWDAYSHWGLRARAYVLAGGIVDAGSTHEYYPPLVPLLEAWYYVHRGAALIDQAKVLWALVGAAFMVVLAGHARLAVRRDWHAPALAAGILLLTVQLVESFWTGEADLALTAFLTLGVLALFEWQRAEARTRRLWLVLACLFAGAAALTKYEGLYRVLVVAAVLAAEGWIGRRDRVQHAGAAAGVALASGLLLLPWMVLRITHALPASNEHTSGLNPGAAAEVLRALVATFGGVRTGGWSVVLVLGALAVSRRLLRPPLRLLTLVSLAQGLATLGAFFITGSSPAIQVQTSATRLAMQVLPVALFALGAALSAESEDVPGAAVLEAVARPTAPRSREVASV